MKFVCIKKINNKNIIATVPLLEEYIHNAGAPDDDFLTFDYPLPGLGSEFPIAIDEEFTYLIANLKNDIPSLTAFVHPINEDILDKYGDLEFEVTINAAEQNALLMFLLRYLTNRLP